MGKSKSHPCKHPTTARRDWVEDPNIAQFITFRCVKCGQKVDAISGEIIHTISVGKSVKHRRRWPRTNRQHRHGHYLGTENG
jgi:hypothetical protein